MEEILDQEFNENENDETRINRITAFSRYFYCVYAGASRVVGLIQLMLSGEDIQEKIIIVLVLSLNMLMFVLFVYYNIRHAALERTERIVMPAFRKPLMLVFLFYVGYLVVRIFRGLVNTINYSSFVPFEDLIYPIVASIILGGIVSLIFIREYTYLKRLNNQ